MYNHEDDNFHKDNELLPPKKQLYKDEELAYLVIDEVRNVSGKTIHVIPGFMPDDLIQAEKKFRSIYEAESEGQIQLAPPSNDENDESGLSLPESDLEGARTYDIKLGDVIVSDIQRDTLDKLISLYTDDEI